MHIVWPLWFCILNFRELWWWLQASFDYCRSFLRLFGDIRFQFSATDHGHCKWETCHCVIVIVLRVEESGSCTHHIHLTNLLCVGKPQEWSDRTWVWPVSTWRPQTERRIHNRTHARGQFEAFQVARFDGFVCAAHFIQNHLLSHSEAEREGIPTLSDDVCKSYSEAGDKQTFLKEEAEFSVIKVPTTASHGSTGRPQLSSAMIPKTNVRHYNQIIWNRLNNTITSNVQVLYIIVNFQAHVI